MAVTEAERKIAQAKGDSAQAVIEAPGCVEAIKKKLSLTPLYFEYIKIQEGNGEIPNSGFLIQPGGKQ